MIAQITAMGQSQIIRNVHNKRANSVGLLNVSAPYFERNSFINEEVSAQELSVLHDLGFTKMTEKDLLETKVALNVIGYNPATKLINLLIENEVLGFSRPGVDRHPHLNLLRILLPRFKKECRATHLALALPKSLQRLLDIFLLTGEIMPNLSAVNLADYGLQGDNDYVSLLKAARLAGYKLIAIKPDTQLRAFEPQQERTMAGAIKDILCSEEQAKVIFLAPERHLGYESIGDWMPVAGILKNENVAICTVNQYWHSEPQGFASLLHRLEHPVVIAAKDVKMFAALQSKSLPFEAALTHKADLTVIYPKKSFNGRRLFKQAVLDFGKLLNAKSMFGYLRRY